VRLVFDDEDFFLLHHKHFEWGTLSLVSRWEGGVTAAGRDVCLTTC
jgi:hypothetical protein